MHVAFVLETEDSFDQSKFVLFKRQQKKHVMAHEGTLQPNFLDAMSFRRYNTCIAVFRSRIEESDWQG